MSIGELKTFFLDRDPRICAEMCPNENLRTSLDEICYILTSFFVKRVSFVISPIFNGSSYLKMSLYHKVFDSGLFQMYNDSTGVMEREATDLNVMNLDGAIFFSLKSYASLPLISQTAFLDARMNFLEESIYCATSLRGNLSKKHYFLVAHENSLYNEGFSLRYTAEHLTALTAKKKSLSRIITDVTDSPERITRKWFELVLWTIAYAKFVSLELKKRKLASGEVNTWEKLKELIYSFIQYSESIQDVILFNKGRSFFQSRDEGIPSSSNLGRKIDLFCRELHQDLLVIKFENTYSFIPRSSNYEHWFPKVYTSYVWFKLCMHYLLELKDYLLSDNVYSPPKDRGIFLEEYMWNHNILPLLDRHPSQGVNINTSPVLKVNLFSLVNLGRREYEKLCIGIRNRSYDYPHSQADLTKPFVSAEEWVQREREFISKRPLSWKNSTTPIWYSDKL